MKHGTFQNFVFDLFISTTEAGGNLTLDKDVPLYGTLIAAIEMLAPYLPEGFGPRGLSSFNSSTAENWVRSNLIADLMDQNRRIFVGFLAMLYDFRLIIPGVITGSTPAKRKGHQKCKPNWLTPSRRHARDPASDARHCTN